MTETPKFTARPLVYCEECDLALMYLQMPDGKMVLQHPAAKCSHSQAIFAVPAIELQQITSSPA